VRETERRVEGRLSLVVRKFFCVGEVADCLFFGFCFCGGRCFGLCSRLVWGGFLPLSMYRRGGFLGVFGVFGS